MKSKVPSVDSFGLAEGQRVAGWEGEGYLLREIGTGIERKLITRKFRTAGALRRFLETAEWE